MTIIDSHGKPDPGSCQLLTKRQLAEELVKSERWVELQVNRGMPRLLVGRTPRFDRAEVRTWIRATYEGSAE